MAFIEEQNGRPVQPKFLDMMPLKLQSEEEVKNALHKLPELKLRPEKLLDDEDVVNPLSCKNVKDFPYLDPVPSTMLHVNIRELSSVDIDWKMLTLDRPETVLEINIFSRMVYLDKLMTRDIIVEKKKKEREKYVRLRTKGKWKPLTDSDVDKSDEFTYEYFSRFSGSNDTAQTMEEMTKPKTPEDAKSRPATTNENQKVNKIPTPPPSNKNKRPRVKKKLRRKKKKKKKSKKSKLRKRKPNTNLTVEQRLKKFRRLIASSHKKSKKSKTLGVSKKKSVTSGIRTKKKSDSNKTLVQMLKTSEQVKKKPENNPKSKSPIQTEKTND